MRGYVVVVEGDDESGYSTRAPDLPGVVAAAATKAEILALMRAAMAKHLALVHIPAPSDSIDVTVLDPAGA
jgi:predicted RNase H-like HicB family nuclease